MTEWRSITSRAYWVATVALLAIALALAALAPSMGPIQKIFYLHLPVAINTLLSALVMCIACVGYLGGRRQMWDDLAHAAARVTVLNATVLLLTGMFWARMAWGQWWTWSPRLAFSLLMWLLYAAYLALRPMIDSVPRRAMVCAVYGIIAFLDVPLVYLSVKLLPDIHPTSIELAPDMRRLLLFWFVPVTMLRAGLVAARFSLTPRSPEARREPNRNGPLRPTGVPT